MRLYNTNLNYCMLRCLVTCEAILEFVEERVQPKLRSLQLLKRYHLSLSLPMLSTWLAIGYWILVERKFS
ncbi:hypothetical protein VNO77_43827 [Canavalia gladiata]|uniref:Uncharacterized protein n=1 Tax=Canavalia gladiata TaxID=3824 RepID=A0AAN9PPS7_CANGL